ncbi:MAG TPA: hypothetical protein GXX46_10230 [Peptococcaceae bacterium]|nr:hypothetical protein [Peptococcaceae bacterium]
MIKAYKCPMCGEFEVDRKLSEGELENCPKCNNKVKRVWTPIPSIWKTSGAFGKSTSSTSSKTSEG